MTWANPDTPNLSDYTLFLQDAVGINVAYLPADSPFISYAFNRALGLVINLPGANSGIMYTLAVYNCAAHIQLMITPDQVVDGVSYDFFKKKRNDFDLLHPVVGLVASSSDEGTSTTNAVPDALRQLTISDLGFMRTVWGREFMAFNQDFGELWGLS
jgi:hypothetical protein